MTQRRFGCDSELTRRLFGDDSAAAVSMHAGSRLAAAASTRQRASETSDPLPQPTRMGTRMGIDSDGDSDTSRSRAHARRDPAPPPP